MQQLPAPLPRNPHTHRLHLRDLAWQIYLPVGLMVAGGVALTTLAILAAFGVSGTPAADSAWADVSLIFLILIAAAVAVMPLALLGGLVVGMWYGLRYLPGYARLIQTYAARFARVVRQVADRAASPLIAVERWAAAVRGGARGLTERTHRR